MPLTSNIGYADTAVKMAGRGVVGRNVNRQISGNVNRLENRNVNRLEMMNVNLLEIKDINNVKASQIVMQMFGCFGNIYNKQTNKQTNKHLLYKAL